MSANNRQRPRELESRDGAESLRHHAPHDDYGYGPALHDLFGIAVEFKPPPEAQELAKQAFRAYGSRHPRLPALARDVAHFWMGRGRFAPALDVFRAVQPHITDPGEQLLVAGNLGRAAGGAGDRQAFEEAWEQVWTAEERDRYPLAVQGLLDLAHGACSLGDWPRAEKAAEAARDLAQKHGHEQVVIRSETLLDAARRKRGIETPVKAAEPESVEDTQELAADFVRSLRTAGAR
jgi:hypothetical protein